MPPEKKFLACDIGGSKTNLSLVTRAGGPLAPIAEATLKSADFTDATELILKFLADTSALPEQACIGVAGPVIDNRSTTTNLPWFIDGDALSQVTGIRKIRLINDLEATAAAITLIDQKDLYTLNEGHGLPTGNIAVISPGTGLGESFLIWDKGSGSYLPHSSEGGHTDFAPCNSIEDQMLGYLRNRIGHVSYELVCSGLGLSNIYFFLKDSGLHEEPPWLSDLLISAEDPSMVIINTALDRDRECPICSETVKMFVSILGAEAGNLAIKVMARGGVYIGGGIPSRITSILDSSAFLKSFLNKGRMSRLLTDIPVNVILDQKAPLKGAAKMVLAGL
ncbi:MAG: glucokinase [Proteobacteria bacterium]|nr:glucokinase [Pseudomonadota bacterium]MBU1737162.1 glucokinase [Pseudomonadota bacterium]